jgi:ankyrin repeat protein
VKLLIETGKVNVDAKDDSGRTSLSWTSEIGCERALKLLLETDKADIDTKDNVVTPRGLGLYSTGYTEELLLETRKVDIDATDNSGRTLLSWAPQSESQPMMTLLIKTGKVDIDAKDDNGRTPLSWAS